MDYAIVLRQSFFLRKCKYTHASIMSSAVEGGSRMWLIQAVA